jgi:type I restriction enzyme S subunit
MILKDICVVDWGNTELTKSSYVENGRFLAVSAAGCDGKIDHYEHESDVSVLSAIGAQCGKMFFPNTKFTAIKNTITLKPKENVLGKYIFYLFTSINLPKRGTGQPFISKGDIEKFVIPQILPLPIQQKIVAKLDKIFAEIDKAVAAAEANVRNTKDFLNNFISEKLNEKNGKNFEFKKIIEVLTDYHANGSYKVLKKNVEIKSDKSFAWMVRSTDFENNFQNNFRYIDKKAYEFLKKSKIFGGEILMCKIGNAGEVYLMPKISSPCSLAMNLFLIRFNSLIKYQVRL